MNVGEDFHQLVHHQRHRIIENRNRQGGLDDLLDGVPLYSLLRTRRGCELVWCSALELQHAVVVVWVVVPRAAVLGGWVLPELGRVVLLVPTPRSWPLSPWGGLSRVLSEVHRLLRRSNGELRY